MTPSNPTKKKPYFTEEKNGNCDEHCHTLNVRKMYLIYNSWPRK